MAILGILGIDGTRGWAVLKWIRRGFRAEPEQIVPVRIVSDAVVETKPTYPKINPPGKDRTLVAREDELAQMRTILESRHGVQITGQKGVALKAEGGRGKTSLAREYADRFGPRYDGGAWLRAQSRLTLLADLAALGHAAFQMDVPDPVTEAHGLAVLQNIVSTDARWLLVYDNIDDHADIKALMCNAANVDVIVTTRLALGFDGFGRIDVDVLKFDTPQGGAVQLLLQEAQMFSATDAEKAEARDVAEQLGGLPLALVMGGALVREEGWSLSQLRTEMAQVLAVVPENGDYPDSVAGAVMLTYGRLQPDAQALADLCAWLAPEGLSEDLFAKAVADPSWARTNRADVTENLIPVLEDTTRLREALRGLRRWSVLSGDNRSDMHRLTQTVLRVRQEQDGQGQAMARAAAAVLAAQFPYDSDFVEFWPTCRALLPHVQSLWSEAEPLWEQTWAKPDWQAMDFLLNQAGVFLSIQQDLPGAIRLGRASLKLTDVRLGEDDRDVPVALGNLAINLADTGALEEAQEKIDRAVSLDEMYRKGDARVKLAARYMQQANVAFRRIEAGGKISAGAEAQAEGALEKARVIWQELFGAKSLEMAHYWNQLGFFREKQDRPWDALDAYGQGFEITNDSPDADPAVKATRAMNFGAAALRLGRAEEALDRLQLAYDLAEIAYADIPEHPSFIRSQQWLTSCALVLARKGQAGMRAKAEALCAKHGLNLAQREAIAAQFPPDPIPRPDDA